MIGAAQGQTEHVHLVQLKRGKDCPSTHACWLHCTRYLSPGMQTPAQRLARTLEDVGHGLSHPRRFPSGPLGRSLWPRPSERAKLPTYLGFACRWDCSKTVNCTLCEGRGANAWPVSRGIRPRRVQNQTNWFLLVSRCAVSRMDSRTLFQGKSLGICARLACRVPSDVKSN